MSGGGPYFGKYRGVVTNPLDPEKRGRIMAIVPSIEGYVPTSWALPCFPSAGTQAGFFTVPPIQAAVWIEFENGDLDKPIWSGCWYATAAEVPPLAAPAVPPMGCFVMQTMGQTTLMVSDVPGPTGGILLKTKTGAMIAINETGITISNGQGATIMMNGPTVTINNGALAIT